MWQKGNEKPELDKTKSKLHATTQSFHPTVSWKDVLKQMEP
jgi:hypothetical protein